MTLNFDGVTEFWEEKGKLFECPQIHNVFFFHDSELIGLVLRSPHELDPCAKERKEQRNASGSTKNGSCKVLLGLAAAFGVDSRVSNSICKTFEWYLDQWPQLKGAARLTELVDLAWLLSLG